jgi:hypothetical protein
MNGDWTDPNKDLRRCANGEWLGCLLMGLMLAIGAIVGWAGYHWIAVCP